MKTYLIIGAGPAGLAAASIISSDSEAQIFIVDTGSKLADRNHRNPTDLGCGVGGTGLFSDGKFSYYPSGTKLYDLACKEDLQLSYCWMQNLLEGVGIKTQPFPDKIENNNSTLFSVKNYWSSYGSLEQRYLLIEKLTNIKNCRFILNSQVIKIIKNKPGKYTAFIKNLINSQEQELLVDNIILAMGRLGPLEFQRMLGEVTKTTNDLKYEFGLRIESRSEIGFLSRLKNPDVKTIWKVPFGEIRTFCTCRNGEIWNIPYGPISAISGRSDGQKTDYSNFGLLVRFTGEYFNEGRKIFEKILDSKTIQEGKVLWQSLESFMEDNKSIQGTIVEKNRPWYPNEKFENQVISDVIGSKCRDFFRFSLKKLIEWSPDLLDSSTAVMFPVVEGIGSYLNLTDHLQLPGEQIWCCGDSVGMFRGIIPAFISGHYAGRRAMLSNQNKLKIEISKNNSSRVGVGVIIIRNDGKVLLGKRQGSHGAGTWAFPGGNCEINESLTACAKREVFEETGLIIDTLNVGPVTEDYFEEINVKYTTYFVIAKYKEGIPEIKEPHKCLQWIWIDWLKLFELQENLFKPIQSLLKLNIHINELKKYLYPNLLKTTPYKLVTFDLDGTLVRNTTTTLYFAELLGVKEQVIQLEKAFSDKKLDSTQFMEKISGVMCELSPSIVEKNLDMLPFIQEIKFTIDELKNAGITTMIVTTANQLFAEAIQKKFGFDYAFGTLFELNPNGTLGRGISVCSGVHKIQHVRNIANNMGIAMDAVVAIGDSLSDVYVFSKVGLSMAINYDAHLEGKADFYLKTNTLSEILFYFDSALNSNDKYVSKNKNFIINNHNSLFQKNEKSPSHKDIFALHARLEYFSKLDSFSLINIIISGHIESIKYIFDMGYYKKILPDDLNMLSAEISGECLSETTNELLKKFLLDPDVSKHFGIQGKTICKEIFNIPETKIKYNFS